MTERKIQTVYNLQSVQIVCSSGLTLTAHLQYLVFLHILFCLMIFGSFHCQIVAIFPLTEQILFVFYRCLCSRSKRFRIMLFFFKIAFTASLFSLYLLTDSIKHGKILPILYFSSVIQFSDRQQQMNTYREFF